MTMNDLNRIRVVTLVFLLATLWAPAVARGAAIHLAPNGIDDTAQLQAALDSCSGAEPRCRIVLAEGVFYTDVLLVHDFRGRIHGQGVGRTIVRPVQGRPLRSSDVVFLNDPTLEEPYPILMHFADGGDVHLADFTIDFPEDMEVEPYDVGLPVVDALLAAVMVDGTEEANLTVARLEINAREKPPETSGFGSTLLNAVRFEGQIRLTDPDDSGGLTTPLGRGTFVAHDVSIRRTGLGFALRDALDVDARIVDNDVQDVRLMGIFLADLGDSDVRVARNFVSSEWYGVWILRGFRPPADPSSFEIERNEIRINEPGAAGFIGPGSGVLFDDFTPDGGIDDASVRHNDFKLGVPSFEAVFVLGDRGGVRVAKNEISGIADAGISVFSSQGTRTRHNDFSNLEPAIADVWLFSDTSECRVIEPGATVLDEGTDNEVETGP